MKRRKFIKRAAISLAAILVPTGLFAWQIAPFMLEFVHHKMPITNLPENLIGKTLMQISDMHVGVVRKNYLIESLKKAQNYKPDFVVYTGDFVSYEKTEPFDQLKEVMENAVFGRLGTIAILGNHDYGEDWNTPKIANTVIQILESKNITVLRNAQKRIEGLNFIGIDDKWGPNFDPKKVLNHVNHSKANIVLCHNPDVCDMPVWNFYKGWILSGHTHGGQVKPPFLPPTLLPVDNKK